MNELLDYCRTPIEERYVKALIASKGNQSEAARSLGKGRSTVKDILNRVKGRAALKDRKGHAQDVPEGFNIKGVSTLYNDEGGVTAQWVKTDRDTERQLEAVERAVSAICESLPSYSKVKQPKSNNKDLLTLYTFTDYHLGMLAWDKEAGEDWDLEIAEQVFFNALETMIAGSPDSETCIINIQGDWEHWDSLTPVTPMSGHVVDADSRFDKLVELSIRILIQCTHRLLEKHKNVRVLVCEGNHNMTSSVWLRKCMKSVFTKNTRVEVDDTAFPYYAYLHDKIMLGFHHGHKKNNKSLPTLFSSEPRYREMWGSATYTYIHTGHYHHAEQDMAEAGGAIVERHPTLSARDAYAARGGYVSRRAARAITYHGTKGEISRTTAIPEYD